MVRGREGRVWRESRRRWRQLQWAAEEAVSVGWESRAIFLTLSKGVSAVFRSRVSHAGFYCI